MELLAAIALLCQIGSDNTSSTVIREQVQCQQSYIHCVNLKQLPKHEALERCVLERKL